jgi:hypothetical protein
MVEKILMMLKEQGVSEETLKMVTEKLSGITDIDGIKNTLAGMQDKLPEGLMDKVNMLDMGGLKDKAGEMMGNVNIDSMKETAQGMMNKADISGVKDAAQGMMNKVEPSGIFATIKSWFGK